MLYLNVHKGIKKTIPQKFVENNSIVTDFFNVYCEGKINAVTALICSNYLVRKIQ